MKKTLLTLAGVVTLGISAYTAYRAYDINSQKGPEDLLLANVEALADKESGLETYTTWSCDASSFSSCHAKCPACGTEVQGTGALTGSHRCKQ